MNSNMHASYTYQCSLNYKYRLFFHVSAIAYYNNYVSDILFKNVTLASTNIKILVGRPKKTMKNICSLYNKIYFYTILT